MSNDGGPAFPHEITMHANNDGDWVPPSVGMSLRDYFAAQALSLAAFNALGRFMATNNQPPPDEAIAREAYAMADAMLAERAK